MKRLLLAALVSLFFVSNAQAQSVPAVGAACTNSGWLTLGLNQILYCNGTTWSLGEEILSTGSVGIGSVSPVASLDLSQKTDALALPSGLVGQRPSSPIPGMIRYNSTATATLEAYINNAWASLTTGGPNATINLGTSASITNPSRTSDLTTGLFSPATSTVAVSVGGTQQLTVNVTGVGIGTSSLANKLDVYGSAAVGSYAGTAAPTNGLAVSNQVTIGTTTAIGDTTIRQFANGDDALVIQRNTDTSFTGNYIRVRNAANNADIFTLSPTQSGYDAKLAMGGGNLVLTSSSGCCNNQVLGTASLYLMTSSSNTAVSLASSGAFNATSGSLSLVQIFNASAYGGGTFNPTSGNATFTALNVAETFNQTGTATGVSRGLYLNPTVTSAYDFRAIETTGYTYNLLGTPPTTVQQVLWNAPTLAAASATTVTNAATQAITGAPIAGTNVTITHPYALWIEGGAVRMDGKLGIGAVTPLAGLDVQEGITSVSGYAFGARLSQPLTATANGDTLTALYISPSFSNGSYTSVANYGLIVAAGTVGIGTTATKSTMDIGGSVGIGTSYAGVTAAPSNGAIIQGNVGIGTSAPAVTLQVAGEILPGSTGATCSGTTQGAIRYNSSSNVLQFCDGSNWGSLPATSCSSSTPAGFVFTNQTGAAVSTLTTSNIVQITGITCNVTTQVSGSGSPQYQICSTSNCSTVVTSWTSSNATLSNGQYVQMRLTSSSGGSTATTATLSVGSASTSWTVTTAAYCTGSTPTAGTLCSDGTMYAALDAGSVQMFVTPCSQGQTYSGSSCTGTLTSLSWNNGTGSGTSTGATSTSNGLSNTNTLVALADTDSPYDAALACHNLNFGGHTDWFLPSFNQYGYILANKASLHLSPNNTTTSTEISTTTVDHYNGTNGGSGTSAKTTADNVTCMRENSGATSGCGVSGTISTQTQQTLTVPAGCTVTFKVWGAAGGTYIGAGGGGGYATGTVSAGVNSVTYYLVVGGAGGLSTGGAGVAGYTGGTGSGYNGGGGAASGIWTGGYGTSGTPFLIAAGGGGGSGGGAGSAGGSGGSQNSSTAGGSASSGGGGGGGYSTGGAGGLSGASGNGGTNYAFSGGSTSAGSGGTPGNSGDSNRPTNAGAGASSNGSGYTGAIYYSY